MDFAAAAASLRTLHKFMTCLVGAAVSCTKVTHISISRKILLSVSITLWVFFVYLQSSAAYAHTSSDRCASVQQDVRCKWMSEWVTGWLLHHDSWRQYVLLFLRLVTWTRCDEFKYRSSAEINFVCHKIAIRDGYRSSFICERSVPVCPCAFIHAISIAGGKNQSNAECRMSNVGNGNKWNFHIRCCCCPLLRLHFNLPSFRASIYDGFVWTNFCAQIDFK